MSKWKFYNRNPHKYRLNDCVCRAISTATGLNYKAVDNLLKLTANTYTCEPLCVCCYNYLLENILNYERRDSTNKTVSDIADIYNDRTVIIRIEEHLTVAVKGTILDTWNCSKEIVDCYWLVK